MPGLFHSIYSSVSTFLMGKHRTGSIRHSGFLVSRTDLFIKHRTDDYNYKIVVKSQISNGRTWDKTRFFSVLCILSPVVPYFSVQLSVMLLSGITDAKVSVTLTGQLVP